MNESSHGTGKKHLTVFSNEHSSPNDCVLDSAWLSEVPKAASSRLASNHDSLQAAAAYPSSLLAIRTVLRSAGAQGGPAAALHVYGGGMGKQSPWRVRYLLRGVVMHLGWTPWVEESLHMLVPQQCSNFRCCSDAGSVCSPCVKAH